MRIRIVCLLLGLLSSAAHAQVSRVWVSDNGNGTYKNPIIHADYSDLDVIRVGEDYYLVASSFDAVPGLPILHSRDLVNWTIVGHALLRQPPYDHFSKGEPVMGYKKPATGAAQSIATPQESDEFDSVQLGLQWQWQANPQATWCMLNPAAGTLWLFSAKVPDTARNLWDVPNLLLQKFPAEAFTATTRLKLLANPKVEEEKAGLVIVGMSYGYIAEESRSGALQLVYASCEKADKGAPETATVITSLQQPEVYLRVSVMAGAKYRFSYSLDGRKFVETGEVMTAEPGRWIGAEVGLFCTRSAQTNDAGHVEVDWFRVGQ